MPRFTSWDGEDDMEFFTPDGQKIVSEKPMIKEPNCFKRECKHFIGVKGENEAEQRVTCKAFPNGIPVSIAYGDNLHLKPQDGDHGITYEKL